MPTTQTAAKADSVLLIDDDTELCAMLRKYLSRHGWEVRTAHSGGTGIAAAREHRADLIVLDVMLPDFDGFEVLRRLHREMDVPVLMLTARGEEIDRIVGLELGADDYLSKPFNPRELLARMKAVARRSSGRRPQGAEARFSVGNFTVDPSSRQIFFSNSPVELTDIEYSLLHIFLSQPHETISREKLVEEAFERPFRPLDRSLDMHLVRLRRKLESLSGFCGAIRTVRSSGYMFVVDIHSGEGGS